MEKNSWKIHTVSVLVMGLLENTCWILCEGVSEDSGHGLVI